MDELGRYQCQINLDEIGEAGQLKLKLARVLCVGAGGLANSALPYLAACGVGRITLVDGDAVSESNLHRQVMFTPEDVGKPKAAVMAARLQAQNPVVTLTAVEEFLELSNVQTLIEQHDVVLDCSDNYFTRYLVSDYCQATQTPNIYAAVVGFEGMVTVFSTPEQGGCYRCLYPEPPALQNVGNCSDMGVLGTVPGLLGLMQATEALKYLLGMASPLTTQLLKADFLSLNFKLRSRPDAQRCPLCSGKQSLAELGRYSAYKTFQSGKVKQLPASQLDAVRAHYYCLDVREANEVAAFDLGFHSLPLSQLALEALPSNRAEPILIACAHGMRSQMVCQLLLQEGYTDVTNLQGGAAAYQREQGHD